LAGSGRVLPFKAHRRRPSSVLKRRLSRARPITRRNSSPISPCWPPTAQWCIYVMPSLGRYIGAVRDGQRGLTLDIDTARTSPPPAQADIAFGRMVLIGDAVALGDQISPPPASISACACTTRNGSTSAAGSRSYAPLWRLHTGATTHRAQHGCTLPHPWRVDDHDCRGTRHQLARIVLGS
jgi:hypothetical protein